MSNPWPLFDLSLRSDGLELRVPTDAELLQLLDLARAGIHPHEQMPFGVAWTDLPSPEFERSFLQFHWGTRANWKPESFTLELCVWSDGRLVGIQGLHAERFRVMRTSRRASAARRRPAERQGLDRRCAGH